MIGVIMIARMMPAVRNERPRPKCCDSTSTPHRPNTTDGTTASRSMHVDERLLQPRRRDLRDEQRDAEADRHRDHERDRRGVERAPDERQRAELAVGAATSASS